MTDEKIKFWSDFTVTPEHPLEKISDKFFFLKYDANKKHLIISNKEFINSFVSQIKIEYQNNKKQEKYIYNKNKNGIIDKIDISSFYSTITLIAICFD